VRECWVIEVAIAVELLKCVFWSLSNEPGLSQKYLLLLRCDVKFEAKISPPPTANAAIVM
jgi:hypothetical protein